MAGKLSSLLRTDGSARTADAYEKVFDDFVESAGGSRVDRAFKIPKGVANADYYFKGEAWDCIVELKQVCRYDVNKSFADYMNALRRVGRIQGVSPYLPLGSTFEYRADAISAQDWSRFFERFRPQVPNAIRTANAQLAATSEIIPQVAPRRLRAVWLLNTNDYDLSTDLLCRIAGKKLLKSWKGGICKSTNLAICSSSPDLFRRDRHALHARSYARDAQDPFVREVTEFLLRGWVNYCGSQMGLDTKYEFIDMSEDPFEVEAVSFQGKVKVGR